MAYVIVSLIVLVISLIYSYLQIIFSYWERKGVPHEKPVLIFGNMKGIGTKLHFRDINERLYKRYKDTSPFVGMYMFLRRAAFIMDLDLIKQVLIKDFDKFRDRGIFNNVRDDPLTGHLLALEGEQWRSMRIKLSPVFTSGKMRFMFPTLVGVGQQLAKACGVLINESNTKGEIELKDMCARYTTDVIGTCVFGIECNSLSNPNAEFREKGRSITEKPRHSGFVQAFMFFNPELARFMRMKFFSDSVSEFFLEAIRSAVEYRCQNNIKRNDFLDMLIELKAENEEVAKLHNGIDLTHGLTLEQMAAQAFVFFVAGFETSSSTMSFMLYELCLNQEIQHKLQAEIDQVLHKHKGELTYEAVGEMLYLEQVLSETLRKYPLLPNIVRKSNDDFKVPHTNHIIEKNTTIIIPLMQLHHDPEYFPEPEKFDPERFSPKGLSQQIPFTYMPFGDGPRNCIGLRFGKMQTKIGIISLLRSYKFTVSPRTQVPLQFSKKIFLTIPESGVYVHAELIHK